MIPVFFEHEGKTIHGTLDRQQKGSNAWWLMIDGYVNGSLVLYSTGWSFKTTKGTHYDHLADYFAEFVIAWYQ